MAGKKTAAHHHHLVVEGQDVHAIVQLTAAHGADYENVASDAPYIESAGGKDGALAGLPTRLKIPAVKRLGLVIDADASAERRWQATRDRLRIADVAAPEALPTEGWVGESPLGTRVGVWIMPDNLSPGRLEEMVARLIPANDPCWPHAQNATADATTLGAPFRPIDRLKAELHTWLAWREKPGVPYGVALKARYLLTDTTEARAFVQWFQRLYGPTP